MDPVKVDVRRRKKRKADFEQTANNSEVQFWVKELKNLLMFYYFFIFI
jgi:hypothetical protein